MARKRLTAEEKAERERIAQEKQDASRVRKASAAAAYVDPELLRKAWIAQREATKLIPGLRAIARTITRDPETDVFFGAGTPCTEGKRIRLRVPIDLGDLPDHNKLMCDKYDELGLCECPACRVLEKITSTLQHETAHIAHGSFDSLTDEDKASILKRIVDEHPALPGTRQAKIQAALDDLDKRGSLTYWHASSAISAYLKVLLNALEDARVNTALMKARPGMRRQLRANVAGVMLNGIEGDVPGEDNLMWSDRDPSMQALVGLYLRAAGYDDLVNDETLSPDVVKALRSPEVQTELNKFAFVRGISGVYQLGFPMLEALRHHGYCKRDDDLEDDPPPPPPEPEPSDEKPEPGEGEKDEQDKSDQDDTEAPESDDEEEGAGAMDEESEDDDGDEDGDRGETASDESDDQDSDSEDDADEDGDNGETADDDESEDNGGEADEDDDTEGDGDGEFEEDDDDSGTGGDFDEDTEDGDFDDEDGDEGHGPAGISAEEDGDEDTEDDGDPGEQPMEPEEIEDEMESIFGHGDFNDDDSTDEAKASDAAAEQAGWFETPSSNVLGVRIHTWDKHCFSHSGEDLSNFLGNWPRQDGGPSAHYAGHRAMAYSSGTVGLLMPPEGMMNGAVAAGRRIFTENAAGKNRTNRRVGRVNGRDLARVPVGFDKPFMDRKIPGKKDWFVVIGMDLSGSTGGIFGKGDEREPVVQVLKRAVMAQAELLHRLGVPFAVYAHTAWVPDDKSSYSYGGQMMLDLFEVKAPGSPWGEKERTALRSLYAGQANIDGHTLEQYRKIAEAHHAVNKVILYYTDGAMPAENYTEEKAILIRECAHIARRQDLHLMGVGLGTDSPAAYGMETTVINRVEDLPLVVEALRKKLLSVMA